MPLKASQVGKMGPCMYLTVRSSGYVTHCVLIDEAIDEVQNCALVTRPKEYSQHPLEEDDD